MWVVLGSFFLTWGQQSKVNRIGRRCWACILHPESFCVHVWHAQNHCPSPVPLPSHLPFIPPSPYLYFLCISFGKCYSSQLLPLCRSGWKPSCVLWARHWPQTTHGKSNNNSNNCNSAARAWRFPVLEPWMGCYLLPPAAHS